MLVDHVQAVKDDSNASVSPHQRQKSLRFKKSLTERFTAIQYSDSNCFTLCVSPRRPSACSSRVFHDFCREHTQLRLEPPKKRPHMKPTVRTWDKRDTRRNFGWLRKVKILTVTPFRTKTLLSSLKALDLQSLYKFLVTIHLGLLVRSILNRFDTFPVTLSLKLVQLPPIMTLEKLFNSLSIKRGLVFILLLLGVRQSGLLLRI